MPGLPDVSLLRFGTGTSQVVRKEWVARQPAVGLEWDAVQRNELAQVSWEHR